MLTRTNLALFLLLAPAASAQDLDTAISALVRISGARSGTPVRGTGFVVSLDREKTTIVTASHVIEEVQPLEVTFAADLTKSFPVGVVVGMEAGNPHGLAVLQVHGKLPQGITMLSFDTEVQLQRGEELFLLGFPHMAAAPLTLRRVFAGQSGSFLQLDLPVGEGLSGAPVLRNGNVVGVVTEEDLQLTYAVKSIVAKDLVFGRGAEVVKVCVPGEEHTENGIVFVRICPGTFTMGSFENDPQAYDVEKPAHLVTLSEFWIGKTEITNEQYRSFRSDHQGEAKLPATGISWINAKAACEFLNGRLPTEAEWEYAARAGGQTAWASPADAKTLGEYAWYGEGTGDGPHPVATKRANAWGLHDMPGNVREWVADWDGSYPAAAQSDPTGPEAGKYRILRGGSFLDPARWVRSAMRVRDWPEHWFMDSGFRCARGPRRQP